MFPAFCWHDLPGLIKAGDYHINALPTPPVYGFGRPLPSPPPPCTPPYLWLRLENPESTGRNRPALSLAKTFLPPPASCRARGPDSSLSRGETKPPRPPRGPPGVDLEPLHRSVGGSLSQREANLMWNVFLSLTFYSRGEFCPRSLWERAPCSPNAKVH